MFERSYLKKILSFPLVFIMIYTVLCVYILIKAPDIYGAVFFFYYFGRPSSLLYVLADYYLSLPMHGVVYFDICAMYFLGVIQYWICGLIFHKIVQGIIFGMNKYILHK